MIRGRSFVLAALLGAAPAEAATFTVTNTNTSGLGSLAQAITSANITAATDEIEFNVFSPGVVSIPGPFPAIAYPVVIDGYSQGSATPNDADFGTSADIKVELDGASLTQGQAVLQVDGDAVIITGLAIKNIGEKVYGIRVSAGAELTQIEGNFIGMTAAGDDASEGIGIRNDGLSTFIGGPVYLSQRNLISGNDAAGIEDRGTGTTIANNLIGTGDSGHDFVPNGTGIVVGGTIADNVLIGGEDELSPNSISGNDGPGISVLTTVPGNVRIENNSMRANEGLGIDLGANGVTPNDPTDADDGPNGYQNHPVLTFARKTDTEVVVEGYLQSPPNIYRIEIFMALRPHDSGYGEGFRMVHAFEPTTAGNPYHFRARFPIAQLDGEEEVHISATAQNMSTHETSEFSNAIELVSGGPELVVTSSADIGPGSLRTVILSATNDPGPNTIVFDLDEPVQPINLSSAPLFITDELLIDGYTQFGSYPNTADVGTNATLKVEVDGSAIPVGGTFVVNAPRFTVRGLAITDGNAIGVQYSSGDDGVIEGNFIGTNLAGTAAKGNHSHGIFTGNDTNGIRIGGALPSQRNIVSGNTTHGMRLTGDGAIVRGNIVGADRTGLVAIPNQSRGISIEGTAEVGSDGPDGDPGHNLVAFNAEHGISVSSVAMGVTILGNSVHSNGLLGIELATDTPGVTPNDLNDPDAGANGLQNFPVIESVEEGFGETVIQASLDVPAAAVDEEYVIRAFVSNECDASGHGEGEAYLGARTVGLSGNDQVFTMDFEGLLPDSSFLTLTATEVETGNTSEFSECFSENQPPGPVCGDPSGDDEILAADALTTLRTAVGTASCQLCVCDVNDSGEVTTSDALSVLRVAVGQSVDLDCPFCIGTP